MQQYTAHVFMRWSEWEMWGLPRNSTLYTISIVPVSHLETAKFSHLFPPFRHYVVACKGETVARSHYLVAVQMFYHCCLLLPLLLIVASDHYLLALQSCCAFSTTRRLKGDWDCFNFPCYSMLLSCVCCLLSLGCC